MASNGKPGKDTQRWGVVELIEGLLLGVISGLITELLILRTCVYLRFVAGTIAAIYARALSGLRPSALATG